MVGAIRPVPRKAKKKRTKVRRRKRVPATIIERMGWSGKSRTIRLKLDVLGDVVRTDLDYEDQ